MPDQFRVPFGDAFIVNTPVLDRWAQQLYVEQKAAEQRRQQENQAIDAGIQKEIGKVRSVDTPEVIKAYQEYKALKQNVLFNKDLQKDPLAYNQAQQAMNLRYQNIFTTANKSAEIKKMQEQLATDRIKNGNAYADDAGERISTLMNTPISQVGAHPAYGDLTNWDNYKYQGSNTDFSKIIRDAAGQPRKVYSKEDVMDGGLQTRITPYEFGNTPGQVKDYVLGALAMRQAGRDAAYQWDHLPEKEIEETIKAYQAIPKEKWERMGLPGPQDLLSKNPDNKAENFAAYQAMRYAIANEPKEGIPQYRQNLKAVKDLEFARQKQMEGIKHANSRDLIEFRKKIDPSDTEMNNTWVVNYLTKRMGDAFTGGKKQAIYGGKTVNGAGYVINPDPIMMKAFSRNGQEPDRIYVTEDEKIWPIFYKYGAPTDKDGKVIAGREKESVVQTNSAGHPLVDEDYSQPMQLDQAALALGYKGQTKKQLAETMSGTGAPWTKAPAPSKKYTVNGQSYSHKQLNEMGYDDNEINEAIKAGIIK